ncbi:uncharacterized protein LOC107830363 [Nicotiana tabacum]|uniref:Uncharacterized protein LOC107830363 n=1 Tax=Nicotiana tabacum TaxID=4097 RepID=A0AC58RNV3_TOBAC
MNGFWWRGKGGDTGGIRWMSWKGLCKRKEDGGLGFREVQNFNLAMLAKTTWSLLTRPEALVSRIYKARYFPIGDLLSATVGNNPSYVCGSLCAGLQVLEGGCVRCIGDGRTTKIFHTPWLPSEQLQVIQSVCNNGMEEMVVSELIYEETRTWSEVKLETVFNAQEIELIQKIPLSSTLEQDKWMWLFDPKGMYTVRGGYMRLYDQVRHEIEHPKTVEHCLLNCTMAKTCWLQSHVGWREIILNMEQWFNKLNHTLNKKEIEEAIMICWEIWNYRNGVIWNQRTSTVDRILDKAISFINEWHQLRTPYGSHGQITRRIESGNPQMV